MMTAKMVLWIVMLALIPVSLKAVDVTFRIKGLRNNQGIVWVGVYRDKETFLKKKGLVTDCQQQGLIHEGSVDVLCSLQPGIYGAAAYHDENNNRNLDTNFLGIPTEGYGFPNGVKTKLGLPDFADVSFTVNSSNLELEMIFQY